MSRRYRIPLIVLGTLAGLAVLLVIAALVVLQTDWFRNTVRDRIVAEVEQSTGGRAEIGSFDFEWTCLRATVKNFVLHGTEGPNEPPLFRAASIQVVAKIVSVLQRDIDIESLDVDRPQAYVRVASDGTTNIPQPKVKKKSEKDPIDTILELAVRRFELRNGLLQFADRKMPLNARGENLHARLDYRLAGPQYTGNISISPVYVSGPRPSGSGAVLPVNTSIDLKIAHSRIEITRAQFKTPQSVLSLAGALTDLKEPRGSVRLSGSIVLDEIARVFGRKLNLRRAPPLALSVAAGIEQNQLNVPGLQLDLGQSRFTASGVIHDLKALAGTLRYDGAIALGEVGRIMNVSSHPEGLVRIGGDAKLAGARNYDFKGRITAGRVAVTAGSRRLSNINAETGFSVLPKLIELNSLRLAALGGAFSGGASVANLETFRLKGGLRGFRLRELAQPYTDRKLVWDGTITGPLDVSGRLRGGNAARQLVANARLSIVPGRNGVPVSGLIDVSYDGPREAVNLGRSFIQLPNTRLDLSGELGRQLRVRFASRNLDDLLPAIALASKNPPKTLPVRLANGSALFDGAVTGRISDPVINGRVEVVRFVVNEQKLDRFTAGLAAAKNGASVSNAVLSSGKLAARLDAQVGLRDWKAEPAQPVSATASIRNAALRDVLALAGKSNVDARGTLNADANVSGAIGDPRAAANLNIAKGSAFGEPFDSVNARVNYTANAVSLDSALVIARGARVDLKANYDHPPKQFNAGRVRFQLAGNGLRLENLRTVQMRQPSMRGAIVLNANGDARIDNRPGAKNRVLFSNLNAQLGARGVEVASRRAGDLNATAETRGQNLVVNFNSDLANSNIRGRATWVLAGDYPVDGEVTFAPVRIGALRNLVSPARPGAAGVDGILEGRATVRGPSTKPDALHGLVELARLELDAPGAAGNKVTIKNATPIRVALKRSQVRIETAKFTGPATNLSLGGNVYLNRADMFDVRVNGSVGLELLRQFNSSIYSSGTTVINAAVRGSPSQPRVDGRVELRDASVNMADVPNGLEHANGVILFNGRQAVIQNLTAESGGGKITLSGSVRYAGQQTDFRLDATARNVRLRYPPHASTRIDANIGLNGTAEDSLVSGEVTILETALHSQSDMGSLLSKAGAPPRTPSAKAGMVGNMRLDVHIRNAPAAQVQTTLAQNLKMDIDLDVRGTPASPGLVGRVNISQGEIKFFGSKYTITQGSVSFFNPQRIEPVLNVDLETQARAVEVFLSVNGPMDELKLSYRSDPPLPFSDIVSLLATGKAPATDPVLAAKQPPAPQQSWEQMGASTLLGQAVANPVAGRLQRLFGVTRLKIDPQITGAENNPQARLTMEQQITRDLTFTYITDMTRSNPQVVRMEWAIDPTWSAVAVRQENGQFGVDFYYKKRFR